MGLVVGVGEVWHRIATLIIYQRRMGAQMGKGKENYGFGPDIHDDLQVVGEYAARANLSTTPKGSVLTIGKI